MGFSVPASHPISCRRSGTLCLVHCGLSRGGALRLSPLPWKVNSSVSLKSKITRKTSLSRLTQECSAHGPQPGCSWEWGSQGQTGLQPSHRAPKSAPTPGSLVQTQLCGTQQVSGEDRGVQRLVQGEPDHVSWGEPHPQNEVLCPLHMNAEPV